MVIPNDLKLVGLDHARKHEIPLRSDGSPISPSTLWRWIRKGLEGRDGKRIKLSVVYCGNRPHVTARGVNQFFEAVTEARLSRHCPDEEQPSDATEAELNAAGLR